MPPSTSTPSQDLEPLLSTRQNQLSLLFVGSDAMDTKAFGIIAFNVAIGIFSLQSLSSNSPWLLVPLSISFLLSTAACVYVIWPRNYVGASVDVNEHPEYLSLPKDELILQLLADTEEAIKTNVPINTKKSLFTVVAIVLSLAGIIFVIGCIL